MRSINFSAAAFLALAAWPLAAHAAASANIGYPQEGWVLAQGSGGPCVPGSAPFNGATVSPCPPGYAPMGTPGFVPSLPSPSGPPGATGATGIGVTPGVRSAPGLGTTPNPGATPGVGTMPGIGSTTNSVGVSPYGDSGSLGGTAPQPGGLSR